MGGEGGLELVITFKKNPNLKKKCFRGGGGGEGWGGGGVRGVVFMSLTSAINDHFII